MKEKQLQVFLEGVQKYFSQVAGEEIFVGTPYLVENVMPAAKHYSGVIAISGNNKGIVYFTSPGRESAPAGTVLAAGPGAVGPVREPFAQRRGRPWW